MGTYSAGGCRNHRDKAQEVEMDWPYRQRKVPNNTTRMAMEWNPQGRRSRGRRKQSWRPMVTKDLEIDNIGRTWGEAKLKPYASRGAKRMKSSQFNFCPWIFLGCAERLRDFWSFDFYPHSIIRHPRHLKSRLALGCPLAGRD